MKNLVLAILVALLASLVNAECTCEASDSACLQACVTVTNQCIQDCKGDSTCYTSCIGTHWPSTISGLPSATASILAASAISSFTTTATPSAVSVTQTPTAAVERSGADRLLFSFGLMTIVLLPATLLLQ